jgi:hypothetical protein
MTLNTAPLKEDPELATLNRPSEEFKLVFEEVMFTRLPVVKAAAFIVNPIVVLKVLQFQVCK